MSDAIMLNDVPYQYMYILCTLSMADIIVSCSYIDFLLSTIMSDVENKYIFSMLYSFISCSFQAKTFFHSWQLSIVRCSF